MADEEPIPVAALQHWCYCPRQCALIHLEQLFEENVYTLRGQAVHSLVDEARVEVRRGVRAERALPIWSDRLGLVGRADVVEFEANGTPYPVEYKHGNRRKSPRIAACDDLQLAAQALCLEEMTGRAVPEGALFYASSKRRRTVAITEQLRSEVVAAVKAVRALLSESVLPAPVNDERCRACSLIDICQPKLLNSVRHDASARARLYDPES